MWQLKMMESPTMAVKCSASCGLLNPEKKSQSEDNIKKLEKWRSKKGAIHPYSIQVQEDKRSSMRFELSAARRARRNRRQQQPVDLKVKLGVKKPLASRKVPKKEPNPAVGSIVSLLSRRPIPMFCSI